MGNKISQTIDKALYTDNFPTSLHLKALQEIGVLNFYNYEIFNLISIWFVHKLHNYYYRFKGNSLEN